MSVWMATDMKSASPEPAPTIARRSTVTASIETKAIIAVTDQQLPSNSNDHSLTYLHWWPKKDTQEWVQFDFEESEEVSKVKVYWFDDGPYGGCRIPAAWKVQYQQNGEWKDVENTTEYSITKDDWDSVNFKAVKTGKLRVVIDLPKEFATGLYEIIIE